MGKKKSKANKQKQAKAKAATHKRRQNTKFNIPVSTDGMMMQTQTTSKKDNKTIPRKPQKKFKNANPAVGNTKQKNAEDKDFEDEYRSLQERQFIAQSKKQKSKIILKMAPATLQINQKPTTEQLVDDAASHLNGMQELGQASTLNGSVCSGNPNSNLLQVLASQKRHENYLAQQEAAKPRHVGEGNNYWALQGDDSDDEAAKLDSTPSFNFAAPSFVVPIATASLSSGVFGNNAFIDDDPDL
jgi:hypothetical protein